MVADIAARIPKVLYGPPTQLVTADNKVFTFGTPDPDGYAIVPIGKVRIFPTLSAVPDYPWVEGYDYLDEGTQIRIPHDRTYAGTLYYRGIVQPKDIAAGGTNEPVLMPEASRELIVIEAVRDYASQGSRLPQLAADKASEYAREFARWMLVWRTQFSSGGALGYQVSGLTLSMLNP